jgi:RHS repeat-associated protein
VVLFPPDVDGRRRAKSVLFWSGPDGFFTYPGDRVGADLQEAVFDSDPRPSRSATIAIPVCGLPAYPNDQPFCPNHAVRVTSRSYEYEMVTEPFQTQPHPNNRRLSTESVYPVATQANGTCPGCAYHSTSFSNLLGQTWDGNGRHYNTETHSGNLGNDSRTITTYWTPSVSPWFPNLFNRRTDTLGSSTLDRFFEFTPSNGFPRGDSIYDLTQHIVFLNCRFDDGLGNVGQEFSATYTNQFSAPRSDACSFNYSVFPPNVVGTNGDAFGKVYTYQNGLLKTMRWINANPPNPTWYAKNYIRDLSTGWVTFSSDPTGLGTNYSYDSLGRVTSIIPPGGDAPTNISYDLPTQTTAIRDGGTGLFTRQQYLYDGLGRLLREIRLMPANSYAVRLTRYDPAGHTSFVSEWAACPDLPTCGGASPTAGTNYSNFDPFGRAQTIRKADGAMTTVSFADGSSLYSDTLKTVTVNNITGTCSNGCTGGSQATTGYRYDAFGRLTAVTEPGGDLTSYTYDVNGKITSVLQSSATDSQTRSFTLDLAGFLRFETTPEKGTVSYDTYGSLGNLLSETEPGGLVVSRTYDFAGRLTGVTSGGLRYLTNCFDGGGCVDGNSGYGGGLYPAGKLTRRIGFNPLSPSTPSVTDDLTYSDPAGRLSTQATTVTGGTNLSTTQRWIYNGLGLLAHHYHPQQTGNSLFVVSTDYDAGLLLTEYVNGIPMVKTITYQASGALGRYTTGIGITDVTTTIGQDAVSLLPRPTSIATTGAISNFSTGTYTYDGAGNIMAIGSDAFGYDLRSRLTSATLSSVGSQAYSYDRYGNLLSKAGNTFCSGTCTNNQIAGATYLRGNLTAYAGQNFTWDGLDRMISNQASTLWSYLYDGSDERIAKIPPTGNWTFTVRDEAKKVISEYSGSTTSRDNVFLGNQLAVSYANAAVSGNGPVWVFYASDHLGTPRLLTDAIGSPVEPQPRRYWPYGEAAITPGSFQVLRFATMELDADGGTGSIASDRYYDHARSHVGGLGRFLSPDTLGGRPNRPQSWNRYAYANSNPLRYVDPNGREPLELTAAGLLGLGYLATAAVAVYYSNIFRVSSQQAITVPTYMTQLQTLNGPQVLERERDTGLIGVSDEVVQSKARDKSLPPAERLRYIKEEKTRGLRNIDKARGGQREPKKPPQDDPSKSRGAVDPSSGDRDERQEPQKEQPSQVNCPSTTDPRCSVTQKRLVPD